MPNCFVLARPTCPAQARRSTPRDSKCPRDVRGLSYRSLKGADPVGGRNRCAGGLLQRCLGQPSGENTRRFPNSRRAWPAKPPVSAACFASEPRTARGMWWSRHRRRISRPRAEMTVASRMSPLPRTAMQQAPVFLKNGAFRFSVSEVGGYR